MKNLIKKIVLIVAIGAVAGYSVYNNQEKETLSDMLLANVEALARYELPEVDITCEGEWNKGSGTCWIYSVDCYVSWGLRAQDCEFSGYMDDSCLTPCIYEH
nr:NVEALA domain-containing protein [uncultured Bacteroides sp.]